MVVSETTTRNHTIGPPSGDDDVMTPKSSVRSKSPSPSSLVSSNSRPLISRNSKVVVVTSTSTTTTRRSLSVSFQGEAFSLPISSKTPKISSPNTNLITITKRTPTPTPERKRIGAHLLDHLENTKPTDRCPGRIRQPVLSNGCCEVHKKNKIINSDTDSVSSGSTSGVQENASRIPPSAIIVSPKFWLQTNSRMRRLQDPSSPLSTSPRPKLNTPQKNFNSKCFSTDNYQLSSPNSPNRMRPSSPKLMLASPSRGIITPPRNSVCGISNNFCESPLVLSFAVDLRRGKVAENRFFHAHVLRLLYNRQLQWRFVNARNEDIVLKQKHSVEENLWNAWITVSDLRDSVTKKRHRLQLLRQKLKLASILKPQMAFLEDSAYLDKHHSISLLGAIEALKASTLRLPVGTGETADLQSMKDAISSALDVMHTMGSSMNSLYLQVDEVNLMVTEIAKVSAKERALLRICNDFLSVLSALKVKDCSLRAHRIQTSRVN